jgi:(2Fe-2S) ferredoxin
MKFRQDEGDTKINIAMGTCGIAAGAREILNAMLDELEKREVDDVDIYQTGCIGLCHQEPIVKVEKLGENSVTYGKVDVQDARNIIAQHVINNNVVEDLIIK